MRHHAMLLRRDVIALGTLERLELLMHGVRMLNPQKAFISGKIMAKGNIMLLQKRQGLMGQHKAKIVKTIFGY